MTDHEILYLVVGFLIGFFVAWFLFRSRRV